MLLITPRCCSSIYCCTAPIALSNLVALLIARDALFSVSALLICWIANCLWALFRCVNWTNLCNASALRLLSLSSPFNAFLAAVTASFNLITCSAVKFCPDDLSSACFALSTASSYTCLTCVSALT